MAKISFRNLEAYELRLSRLAAHSEAIAKKAIYAGAEIVADAIRQNIDTLPQDTGVTKRGLEEGFGIAPLQDDSGFINVKLGFDGYNENGMPNVMMARIFESGTSRMPKHPFVRPAINASRKRAEQAMADIIDQEIAKITQ